MAAAGARRGGGVSARTGAKPSVARARRRSHALLRPVRPPASPHLVGAQLGLHELHVEHGGGGEVGGGGAHQGRLHRGARQAWWAAAAGGSGGAASRRAAPIAGRDRAPAAPTARPPAAGGRPGSLPPLEDASGEGADRAALVPGAISGPPGRPAPPFDWRPGRPASPHVPRVRSISPLAHAPRSCTWWTRGPRRGQPRGAGPGRRRGRRSGQSRRRQPGERKRQPPSCWESDEGDRVGEGGEPEAGAPPITAPLPPRHASAQRGGPYGAASRCPLLALAYTLSLAAIKCDAVQGCGRSVQAPPLSTPCPRQNGTRSRSCRGSGAQGCGLGQLRQAHAAAAGLQAHKRHADVSATCTLLLLLLLLLLLAPPLTRRP